MNPSETAIVQPVKRGRKLKSAASVRLLLSHLIRELEAAPVNDVKLRMSISRLIGELSKTLLKAIEISETEKKVAELEAKLVKAGIMKGDKQARAPNYDPRIANEQINRAKWEEEKRLNNATLPVQAADLLRSR